MCAVELPELEDALELGSREIKTGSQDAAKVRVHRHIAGAKTNGHVKEILLRYNRSNGNGFTLSSVFCVTQYFLFYPEKYTPTGQTMNTQKNFT